MKPRLISLLRLEWITRFVRVNVVLLTIFTGTSLVSSASAAQVAVNRTGTAVDNAYSFLSTKDRGSEFLNYFHFGADYHGHEYLKTVSVTNSSGLPIPGQFALVYRYRWQDDGVTDVAYLCDEKGHAYQVEIMYTNAVWSQPFALANAMIKLLGNAMIEANKDRMNAFERKIVQKLVDDADAKALLEWSMLFEQRLGR